MQNSRKKVKESLPSVKFKAGHFTTPLWPSSLPSIFHFPFFARFLDRGRYFYL